MSEVDVADLELAKQIAKRFVQRKDVKAIQVADGGYRPIREPWKLKDFVSHVTGEQTFGHYTCDADGLTKLIVFDIDLDDLKDNSGTWVFLEDETLATLETDEELDAAIKAGTRVGLNPREAWHDRRHPARPWLKQQMRTMVEYITSGIQNHLQLDSAAAYSGNKGCHVYAFFPEPVDARVARKAALMTLEYAGKLISPNEGFEPFKGVNFFKHALDDPYYGFQNLTVEIFPKQATMEGKDLGNLVRLPLSKNLKNPKDPCFFIDQRLGLKELRPHSDPIALLASGNPYNEEC
nr:MAG TPA: DNA primase small subunit [Caudoviricetes sp.]